MGKPALALGLDIGSHAVKICEFTGGGDVLRLARVGSARLPEGAVEDGVLQDSEAVGRAVKALVANLGVKNKNVAISMSGYSVIVKKITLAAMSEDELDEHIQTEAEQYIPFDIDDVYLDYQTVGGADEETGQTDVMLVAAKKDVVDGYIDMLAGAGLRVVVVDVDAFALENACEMADGEGGNVALIDIGATKMSINIIANGASILARDVVMGSAEITRGVANRLGVEPDSAEALKVGAAAPDEGRLPQMEEVFVDVCSQWVLEIKKALDFYVSGYPDDPVGRLILSGGGAKIKGLTSFLAEETGIATTMLDPFAKVEVDARKIDPDYLQQIAPEMAIAAGLAMRAVEI